MRATDLCEECVDDQVEYTPEKLVAHEDGEQKVAEDERAGVLPCVLPNVQGGENESDRVEGGDENEELAVRSVS
jgi:hypothetical protein